MMMKKPKLEIFTVQILTYIPLFPTIQQSRPEILLFFLEVERGDSEENRMLANIFYEEGVQEFNLAHGYRAQTHLGSYLMYHAFVDEIRKATANDDYQKSSQLFKFINKIKKNRIRMVPKYLPSVLLLVVRELLLFRLLQELLQILAKLLRVIKLKWIDYITVA